MNTFQKTSIKLLIEYVIGNLGEYHAVTLRLLVKNVRDLSDDEILKKRLRGVLTYLNRKPQYQSAILILKIVKDTTGQSEVKKMWQKLELNIASRGYLQTMNQLKACPKKLF